MSLNLTALTWNVWSQNLPYLGWRQRANKILPTLQEIHADFVCLQEVRWSWIKDFETALSSYQWTGIARDSSPDAEMTPIFYLRENYILLHTETLWLSEQQDTTSTGWDAYYPRTATFCRFRNRGNSEEITIVNTHLDHWGSKSRELSAELIRKKLELLPRHHPVVVIGDFNCELKDPPCRILLRDDFLQDAAGEDSSPTWRAGAGLVPASKWVSSRKDYIFHRNLTVFNYEVKPFQAKWPPASDHQLVIAQLESPICQNG